MGRCRCTMEPTPRSCRVHSLDIKREAVSALTFIQVSFKVTYALFEMQAYLESLPYGQVGDTARPSLALSCNNGYQLAHPGSRRCRQYWY